MERGEQTTTAAAETVAAEALAWIAGQPDLLGGFLGASGLAPADIRARAGEADFLGFVLDFLMGDEAALLAFAADAGLKPGRIAAARARLPGGDAPHWT